MSNVPVAQKQKFSVAITTPAYQDLINNTLRDKKKADRFIGAITSAVAVNPALQECTPATIVAGALLGESLGLSPSPQLGQYYLVPYAQKEKRDRQGNIITPACMKATFQIGYKGLIQLAIRSGQYKKLNVLEIKKGELIKYDPLEEEVEVKLIDDYEEREKAETIGYYAIFEYVNGFRKAIYWSKTKMLAHADKFSPAFSADAYNRLMSGSIPANELWKYSSFWYKNFDDMAKKTMLRQIISKWGIMSIEMQDAISQDELVQQVSANGVITAEEFPAEELKGDNPFDKKEEATVINAEFSSVSDESDKAPTSLADL